MPEFIDDAIILRCHRFSESSLVATACTSEHGRVDFLSKGCLREKSPLFGHVDHYQLVSLHILERQNSGLDLLLGAQHIDDFSGLRFFPPAFAAAGFLADLVLATNCPGDPQANLFQELALSLRLLAETGEAASVARLAPPSGLDRAERTILADRILRAGLLRILAVLGWALELERCLGCGEPPASHGNALSSRHGGILCPACRARPENRVGTGIWPIGGESLSALQAAVKGADYDENRLPFRERGDLRRLLVDYSQYMVEKNLVSAGPLLQMFPETFSERPVARQAYATPGVEDKNNTGGTEID
ncbi:MAG: DNA repair protein RecO C-terminal domain-containing protein [Planctomycetota bacterium]|jgi:DNA repair protein RecO (recombination protein O)|nr:DNA repair protein RecO C-terminal domain-containing protein [Planctomycetota bacterium]